MTPLVSIVIPALNEEKYLPLLLEDFVKQSEKDFEIIVVDGHSDDKTKEKALEFGDKLHLRVIDSDKRNLSYQRNLGASNAHGEYIYFFDADSRTDSHMIKKIYKHIHEQKGQLYLPYPKPGSSKLVDKVLFGLGIQVVVLINKLGKAYAIGPAIIIKKELFHKINGFDEKAYVSEDQNLVIKARKAGAVPIFLPDVSYSFSMRRYESENKLLLLGKYAIFTLITMFKGAVYTDTIKYKMGGPAKKPAER